MAASTSETTCPTTGRYTTMRDSTLFDMPERTWRRWQAKARTGTAVKGPWPQPARQAARELVVKHALAHPAWGHRKIWAPSS